MSTGDRHPLVVEKTRAYGMQGRMLFRVFSSELLLKPHLAISGCISSSDLRIEGALGMPTLRNSNREDPESRN